MHILRRVALLRGCKPTFFPSKNVHHGRSTSSISQSTLPSPSSLSLQVPNTAESLNSSKLAETMYLRKLIATNEAIDPSVGDVSIVKPVLASLKRLKDPTLVSPIIEQLDVGSMTQSELTLAIQSYDSVKRPDAAIALYDRVVHIRPSILGKIPLVALLKAMKSSPSMAAKCLLIYKTACSDSLHYPDLSTDSNVALSLFSTLMGSNYCTEQHLLDALQVKDNLLQSGVQPHSTVYGFLMNLAGKAKDYRVAVQTYDEMRSSGVPTSTYVESCLLYAARRTMHYDDCWSIYDRIVSDPAALQLNYYIVNTMLQVCNSTGDTSRGLEVAHKWYRDKGVLTWPIIGNIVKLCFKIVPTDSLLHKKGIFSEADRGNYSCITTSAEKTNSSSSSQPDLVNDLAQYLLQIVGDYIVHSSSTQFADGSDDLSDRRGHNSDNQASKLVDGIVDSLSRIHHWRYLMSLKHRLDYGPQTYVHARLRLNIYCLLSMSHSPSTAGQTHEGATILQSRIEYVLKALVNELIAHGDQPILKHPLVITVVDSFVTKIGYAVEEHERMNHRRIFVRLVSHLMPATKPLTDSSRAIKVSERQLQFIRDCTQTQYGADEAIITFTEALFKMDTSLGQA